MVRRVLTSSSVVLAVVASTLVVDAPAHADPAPTPFVAGGSYVALAPARIADTRTGLGAPRARTISARLQVEGVAGVPATGVAAVVLNVTVVQPAAAGYLSVTPTGTTTTSNVNFAAHQTVAQLVTTEVDARGAVGLRASAPTHVVVDVVGWFTDRAHLDAGDTYHAVTNRRVVDTRLTGGPLATGRTRRIAMPAVPAGATAAVVNLTVVRPKVPVYVTTWGVGGRPATSSVNAVAGEVRANRAIVPVAPDGSISVFANGPTDLVVDLNGWFVAGATGASFIPTDPTRITDSRQDLNASEINDTTGVRTSSYVSGRGGLAPYTALFRPVAAWLSATVVTSSWAGWVGFDPYVHREPVVDPPQATTSDVNFSPGVTSNAVLGAIGDFGMIVRTGHVSLAGTGVGDVESVLDVSGWFVDPVGSPSTGLWIGGVHDYPYGGSVLWDRRVTGMDGDIVQVAVTMYEVMVRYRDGTVRVSGSDGMWDTDVVDIAASTESIFLVKRDGTVWVNGPQFEMHGSEPAPGLLRYGPVPGVTDAVSVTVGQYSNARALRRDGTVVAWGREKAAAVTPMTAYGRSVVSSAANRDDGGCVAYADGSVGFDRGHEWTDTDTADHVRTLTNVGAVRVVAQDRARGCFAIDAAQRLHEIDFLDATGADIAPVDVVVPSPPVADLVVSSVSVQTFHGIVQPTLRLLGTDGHLYDRVDGSWSQVEGLAGVTALGSGLYRLIAWSPGPDGDGS